MSKRGRLNKDEIKYIQEHSEEGAKAIAGKIKRSEKAVQKVLDDPTQPKAGDIDALKQQIADLTAQLEEERKPKMPEAPAFDPLNTFQRRSGAVIATEGASQLKTPSIPRNPLDYCRPAKP